MSDGPSTPTEGPTTVVDITDWIDRARADPLRFTERQATEIFLAALASAPSYGNSVFLKGGALMGIRYGSPRQTADLDFTTTTSPANVDISALEAELNAMLSRAAAGLGYPDLVCRVQTVKLRPRADSFLTASFPALELTIAYAVRGSAAETRLMAGQCPTVIPVDINLNEPIDAIEILRLGESDSRVRAYSLTDLIAEKLRALLQQAIRGRNRQQDVYDLSYLIERFPFDDAERLHLLSVFFMKCQARNIDPGPGSLSRAVVIERARAEWHSLALEVGDLPTFESRFEIVETFYRSLPWPD